MPSGDNSPLFLLRSDSMNLFLESGYADMGLNCFLSIVFKVSKIPLIYKILFKIP